MRTTSLVFLTALCASLAAAGDPDPATLDKKVLLGYQGWFTCPADGSGRWTHWARGVPAPETLTVEMYPDLSEFEKDELCEVPGMTIAGQPAYLFSSRNAQTVNRHFRWMKDYGLDGVLVQRFVGEIRSKRAGGDLVLKNIMAAARQSGRTFAIEYDISGGNPATFAQTLKDDWVYLVDELEITAHPNYQRHNGKPVVSIWGMGLNDNGHPPADAQEAKDLIAWFRWGAPEPRHQVTFMGGTPARWGTLTADSRQDPAWAGAYAMMDILQPWNVGRYATIDAVDKWKDSVLTPDLERTAANAQLYMPVVFPGFSWQNLKRNGRPNQIPRLRGEFLWRQAYNAKIAGATALKIAMFDEVDEATAIMKVVSHRHQAPEQGFWLTLDADGAGLPSDWYLRLAGEITRMFHGERDPAVELPENPGPQPQPESIRHSPRAKQRQ
ncbi:MAG: hypothetical protein JNM66_27290 [Bryobacterales bacterium]|nr:hypothetical protein [Bryobacterales bacterium]